MHYDTNREIAALALEQSGYEPKVMEMGRAGLNDLAQNIQVMGGAAFDLVGGLADRASKMAEGLIDFFITPSAPTPEMVQARQQAREEAAEAAFDARRYKTDEADRDMIEERDGIRREQEA